VHAALSSFLSLCTRCNQASALPQWMSHAFHHPNPLSQLNNGYLATRQPNAI